MKFYVILLTFPITICVTAQRAPIRYIPIDSISAVPPGREVKLDFKGSTRNDSTVPPAYPWLRNAKQHGSRWKGDTVSLTIDHQKIQFIEEKGQGIDYYLFQAECLRSSTFKKNHILTISTSIVKQFTSDSILFCLTIELDKKKPNGKWKQLYIKERDLWIKRKDLDGVLISEIEIK